MDDVLSLVAALPVATVLGIIAVMMILAARAGGWLRERWTKRRLSAASRHEGEGL